jgi:1-deoxy-D-xylulose-5-phosphate reductoisomerase
MSSGVDKLNIFDVARLDFEAPQPQRFPCLDLAYQAINANGTAPAVLNAANEIAVQAFLDERLAFDEIPRLIEYVLSERTTLEATDLEVILAEDQAARQLALQYLDNTTSQVNYSS